MKKRKVYSAEHFANSNNIYGLPPKGYTLCTQDGEIIEGYNLPTN